MFKFLKKSTLIATFGSGLITLNPKIFPYSDVGPTKIFDMDIFGIRHLFTPYIFLTL